MWNWNELVMETPVWYAGETSAREYTSHCEVHIQVLHLLTLVPVDEPGHPQGHPDPTNVSKGYLESHHKRLTLSFMPFVRAPVMTSPDRPSDTSKTARSGRGRTGSGSRNPG